MVFTETIEKGSSWRYQPFFFLISKNIIYTKGYSMHQEHRANPENTRRKQRKNKKETQSTD